MPTRIEREGLRLPASYANFYIANTRVLVPTFADPADEIALSILRELFPNRRVVGIDCRELIWGLGTFHCLTQQQPASERKSKRPTASAVDGLRRGERATCQWRTSEFCIWHSALDVERFLIPAVIRVRRRWSKRRHLNERLPPTAAQVSPRPTARSPSPARRDKKTFYLVRPHSRFVAALQNGVVQIGRMRFARVEGDDDPLVLKIDSDIFHAVNFHQQRAQSPQAFRNLRRRSRSRSVRQSRGRRARDKTDRLVRVRLVVLGP